MDTSVKRETGPVGGVDIALDPVTGLHFSGRQLTPSRAHLLPLLLAADKSATQEETQPLDRLRMQKGIFLLEQRGPLGWRDMYTYKPYNWGPYSPALADDLELLVRSGYLHKVPTPGGYAAYRTTTLGDTAATRYLDELPSGVLDYIRDVRKFVTTRTFGKLLRDVYAAFPEYATKSRLVV